MLILDYSQIYYSVIHQFSDDIRKGDDILHLFRNAILSSIKSKKKKFREYADEVIVACDGQSYWRKDVFPHYKASRKTNRNKIDLPWTDIFAALDVLYTEFSQNLPYKFIKHDKAEADDVMAILVEDIANKNLKQVGLEMEPTKVLLSTSDKDISQLLKYQNVRQYSPMGEKFITLDKPSKEFLRRLILTGDSSDGIPGIFSQPDCFITKTRQPAHTEKKLQPFIEAVNMLDATDDEFIKKRIMLNTQLISFNGIPQKIRKDVVSLYNEPVKGNKTSTYKYLATNRCHVLLEDIENF
jgi:5'-3' exonuclease